MAKISYTRQGEAPGLGHAIYQAKDFAAGEPFAALLPDDVIDAEKPAIETDDRGIRGNTMAVIATMQIAGEAISSFRRDRRRRGRAERLSYPRHGREPPFAEAVRSGHHWPVYLTPDIFEAIERTTPGAGGEIQITDAMRLLLKDRPFYAVKLEAPATMQATSWVF